MRQTRRIFWDFKRAFFGLPFALPLTTAIVVFPAAAIGALWLFQYQLPSSIYYDEYDREAREQVKPKLG